MNEILQLKNALGNKNPEQLVVQMVNKTNPILGNLINDARKGDYKSVENFVRNLYKENGRDFDKEFTEFMSNFK